MRNTLQWMVVVFIAIALPAGAYFYMKKDAAPVVNGGGVCTYDTSRVPAKVTGARIGTNDWVYLTVAVKTKDSTVQSFDVYRKFGQTFPASEWVKAGIKEGDSITCYYKTRVTGDCSPELWTFLLVKYKNKTSLVLAK